MTRRTERISAQIIRELSEVVQNHLKDPRIGFVTFSHVDVSPDLSHAKIYFTVLGEEKEKKSTLYALINARHYLKNALKERLKLRRMPELEFIYDDSIDKSIKLLEKIEEIRKRDED